MKARVPIFPAVFLLLSSLAYAQCNSSVGNAFLSSSVNWSQTPDLSFAVIGGPSNTCGDFLSTRNGVSDYNSGQVCTDANGTATRGPWTWANTSADQTDTNIRIHWPGNSCTYFTTNHYWDKSCPTPHITSSSGI